MLKFSDIRLEDLLPHRGRMLLVREILEVDAIHAVTRCVVDRSWPLVRDNAVHPLILLELAAQAAGVCNGWDRIQNQGPDSENRGWLVGIKKAEFFIDRIPVGGVLVARAENSYNFGKLREVSCLLYKSKLSENVIAKITLQLFQA